MFQSPFEDNDMSIQGGNIGKPYYGTFIFVLQIPKHIKIKNEKGTNIVFLNFRLKKCSNGYFGNM
jgi:hypothetical protein